MGRGFVKGNVPSTSYPMSERDLTGEHMKVAISGQDDFVQPYLEAALGDNLVQITPEILNEKMHLPRPFM